MFRLPQVSEDMMDNTTVWFQGSQLSVVLRAYANGRPALQLVTPDGEPYATATVNLPEQECPPGFVFVKDYAENAGLLEALVSAGVVDPPVAERRAGFAVVPVCRLLVG